MENSGDSDFAECSPSSNLQRSSDGSPFTAIAHRAMDLPSMPHHRARALIAVAVAIHALLLVLAMLPASRFSSAVFPLYDRYIRWTGQPQNWAMYQYPDQVQADYQLIAYFPDGRQELPWGSALQMKPRQTYFLEALLLNQGNHDLAWNFLDLLRQRYPKASRPNSLILRRTARTVRPFDQVPTTGTIGDVLPPIELRRSW